MSAKSFTDSINQTGITSKGINTLLKPSVEPTQPDQPNVPSQADLTPIPSAKGKNEQAKKVRTSVYINEKTAETLKDFVHMRIVNGKVNYSQNKAIEYALSLLFKSVDNIPKRPADVEDQM